MKNSLVHPFFNTGTVKEYKNYGRGSEKIICLKGEIIKRVRFYENGKIWCKVPIKYCSYHGVAKHYFENGQVQYVLEYNFGIKNGKAREYYSNGQIKKEFNFEQNLLHGTFVEYDSIGNVLLKEKYQQDKKVE